MQRQESTNPEATTMQSKPTSSTHVVTAESVQAEEVPTIPLESLETISTLQPEVAVHSVASTRSVTMPVPLVMHPEAYHRSLGEWLHVWWEGIRPGYLPLSLSPVLVGTAVAWTQTISAHSLFGRLHVMHLLATLVAISLLHVGANLINDYYDYLRGIDTTNTFGPGGLIQQGLIRPVTVLTCGLIALGAGAIIGLILALSTSPLLLLLGVLGLCGAYFYSATTRSLSSLALGELVAFWIFGPLITLGAYVVQAWQASNTILPYGIALGLLAAAIIHVNNMRDAEGDMHAKKRTFANLLGPSWSRVLFVALLLLSYVPIILLALPHYAPHLLLLVLWTLPILVVIISGILRTDSPASMHQIMRQTLSLEVMVTLLLIIALTISAFWALLPHLALPLLP
jgi:1,4-dihydroxy-2-naphthoate octaprenyltransferase